MKFNDDITQSIAATVQNVLEGKPAVKKEAEEFKPHMMYDPKTGKGYKAEKPEDHERMSKMGYVHEKPKNLDEVEEPNVPSKDANMGSKKGEAEFKKLHKGKKVGEKEDGTLVKEAKEVDEESEKQAAYKKVFNAGLKKFGVNGIGELDDEKKKEFFNWVDKNYEAKAEQLDKNGDEEEVDELTDKQKKLPAGLQKAIKAKEKEKEEVKEDNINEAKIKVTAFTGNQDGSGESYKKYGLRLKKVGASYGYDDVELSGPTLALIKFAQRNLGVEGKSIKDIQKELDNM
jgi:hypothetical protein